MQTSSAAATALSTSAQDVCIAPFRRDSLDLDKKAVRTSPNTFSKQSFTDDGRVPVGGDLGAFPSRLIPFEHIV